MESVKATIDLLVLHDPKNRCWQHVKKMFKKARENNTELFGFTFVEDTDWEVSRVVMATDVETGESFVKNSVGRMARVVFGPSFGNSNSRISDLCRSGKTYRGLTFKYANEYDGYSAGYGNCGDDGKKPIQQLDIVTGNIINEFPSITHTAHYIWELGISSASCVSNIRNSISQCLNVNPKFDGNYLGYKWRFKP